MDEFFASLSDLFTAVGSSPVVVLIVGFLILALVWLACRELKCWYWKTNEQIENQKTIIGLLARIEKNTVTKDTSK